MSERELEEVVAFLCGEGQLEGRWFGDDPPRINGRLHPYWWRKNLRAALASSRPLILEEAAKVAREAATEFLTDRNAYVLHGPSGMVRAVVAAIRSLSNDGKAPDKQASAEGVSP